MEVNRVDKKIMEVKQLSVKMKDERFLIKNLNFNLYKGGVTAIIGLSGCGKSLTCKSILGLLDKNCFVSKGEIIYKQKNLMAISNKEMSKIRGNDIGIIMQNPMTAFDPLTKIGRQMSETLMAHNKKMNKKQAIRVSIEMIRKMKVENPEAVVNSYPFSLSGGMLQRIMIALTILLEPELIIADEITTAIDASSRKMVLNELHKMKRNGISLLYITHSFDEVVHIADYVLVMKEGVIVERGDVDDVMTRPKHVYTKALIDSKLIRQDF